MTPPPVVFDERLRRDLESQEPGLARRFAERLRTLAQPCVAITSRRTSGSPLRPSLIQRMRGTRPAKPGLGRLASKFGGVPHAEPGEDWSEHSFLGQIDLAEASAVLPGRSHLRGLLRVDLGPSALRVKHFPEPSESEAASAPPASVVKYEAAMHFRLAWTLPEGDALAEIWPLEREWFEYDFAVPGYGGDARDEFHRLLGHLPGGLSRDLCRVPGDLVPSSDAAAEFLAASTSIDDFAHVLRLTFDHQAGFAWGSNWVYVLVPLPDLARGDFRRAVSVTTNG